MTARLHLLTMRLAAGILICALILGGCGSDIPPSGDEVAAVPPSQFGPVSMRIHPVFTQIKAFQGSTRPNGIEVSLEFSDQFHDPTKATGQVVFELYEFRQTMPDPRGKRVYNPWIGSLTTIADQDAHWSRTSRTYTFELLAPMISSTQNYVLTATFEQQGGGRFFDQMILQGKKARLNQVKVRSVK